MNKLRNIHIHILYTQDTYLFLYIRPFQIQAIWRSVPLLYSTNTLCSTILTYCTVQWQICTLSTLVYTHTGVRTFALYIHLKYITVPCTFSDTTVQLYNTIAVPYTCTLEQYTVHIRLTVRCTWMKIQIYSTLLYGPWGNYLYTNENWKVAL